MGSSAAAQQRLAQSFPETEGRVKLRGRAESRPAPEAKSSAAAPLPSAPRSASSGREYVHSGYLLQPMKAPRRDSCACDGGTPETSELEDILAGEQKHMSHGAAPSTYLCGRQPHVWDYCMCGEGTQIQDCQLLEVEAP